MELGLGKSYSRKKVHEVWGGIQQKGISISAKAKKVILFVTKKGHELGYDDKWINENTFWYTGEGARGDMVFKNGNSAIRDHEAKDRQLFLFVQQPNGLFRFEGELRYRRHESFSALDVEGNKRRAIRFVLERVVPPKAQDEVPPTADPETRPPNATERKGLVTSRVGQGWYRQRLVEKFRGKCAVTGVNQVEILIASHIVPWRDASAEERLDVENGILLSPNYDALFDQHLISFADDGRILLSSRLSGKNARTLGIDSHGRIQVTEGMKPYLARHRAALN